MPAVLYWVPFQVYGNWLAQMVVLVVSVNVLFMVKINVLMESQPAVLVKVSL